jgi:hypothetical protein
MAFSVEEMMRDSDLFSLTFHISIDWASLIDIGISRYHHQLLHPM